MPHSPATHDAGATTSPQLPTTTTLSHHDDDDVCQEKRDDVYSEEREDTSYQQRTILDDERMQTTCDEEQTEQQEHHHKTVSFEPEPRKTDFFEYEQGPDDSDADEEEAADQFPADEHQVESDDDEVGMALGPRTSSYEDIYEGVKGPLEDEASTMQQPVGASGLDIGDRFDTRHVDSEFRTTKASSFENLYEAGGGGSDEEEPGSFKEAGDVEEKDIDEASRSSTDDERPEKGEGEDEKEQTMLTSTRPTPNKYTSPIDVTLESGLDLVGQDSIDEPGLGPHSQLERTHSYNVSVPRPPAVEASVSAATERPRHYSSPDAAPEFPGAWSPALCVVVASLS